MVHQPERGRLWHPRPERGRWQAQTGYPDREGPAKAAQGVTRWPHAASDAACCPTTCSSSCASAVYAMFVQPRCRLLPARIAARGHWRCVCLCQLQLVMVLLTESARYNIVALLLLPPCRASKPERRTSHARSADTGGPGTTALLHVLGVRANFDQAAGKRGACVAPWPGPDTV